MRIISVDQSLSCTALTYWEDGKPIKRKLIKTGSTTAKAKPTEGVDYFPLSIDQIRFIIESVVNETIEFKADVLVLEEPARGAFGTAKARLMVLFEDFERLAASKGIDFRFLSVTAIKSFARELLPEEDRVARDSMNRPIRLKSNKFKKVKMEKDHMVKAAKIVAPECWFDGLKKSGKFKGLEDAADSYLIGYYFLSEQGLIDDQKKETS